MNVGVSTLINLIGDAQAGVKSELMMMFERHKWKLGFGVFYVLLLYYCFRDVKGNKL